MTRIKICGITNPEDAHAACAYGADALGFIFVPGSPRYIGGDRAAAQWLMRAVPPLVWRVGVYDTPPVDVDTFPELHAIQYYHDGQPGAFASDACGPLPIRAFRVRDADSLTEIAAHRGPKAMILLDAYAPGGALGGTGHTFNWDIAKRANHLGLPIILAGGLTPENVADAVHAVRPCMVDVSSGVESEPGRKDHDKLRRFIRAVREANLAVQ